jgi:hypothetical protein
VKPAGLLTPQRFKIIPKSALMLRRIPKILALSAAQRHTEASRSTRPLMRVQQGLFRGLSTTAFNTLAQMFKFKRLQFCGGVTGIGGGVEGGVVGIDGGVEGGDEGGGVEGVIIGGDGEGGVEGGGVEGGGVEGVTTGGGVEGVSTGGGVERHGGGGSGLVRA